VVSLLIARFESAEMNGLDLPWMDPEHPEPVPETCPQSTCRISRRWGIFGVVGQCAVEVIV
jgi:hypothetical protein